MQVSVDVTNTGQRAGKEVVQLYVRDEQARLQRPEKELKAFAKLHLEHEERQTVTLSVVRDALESVMNFKGNEPLKRQNDAA